MRQLRSIGLCVLAALALGAVASAGAWAEAPEIGRCLSRAGGKFKDAGCKTEAKLTTEQKFEWYPGDGTPSPKTAESKPLVKTHFTTKLKEGSGLAKLETGGGVAVTCVNQTSEGEFTGAKTVSVFNVAFTGCESGGFTCISTNPKASKTGEIKVAPLVGVIGIEKLGAIAAQDKLGNDLGPAEGTQFTEFECGPAKDKVRGHVISPIKSNAMASSQTVKFTAKAGKQKPEKFVGGEKQILESSLAGAPFEQAGQTLTTVQTGEEKVEASSVN